MTAAGLLISELVALFFGFTTGVTFGSWRRSRKAGQANHWTAGGTAAQLAMSIAVFTIAARHLTFGELCLLIAAWVVGALVSSLLVATGAAGRVDLRKEEGQEEGDAS